MKQILQILIVEDEAITAEALKQSLLVLGYGIAGVANNATDAIDVLLNKKVDFAILDIQIQGDKNGIWLANYIRKTNDIPYVFLTAFGDEKTILEATSTRPYGYLLKPFVKQNLLASIQVALINYSEKNNVQNIGKNLITNNKSIYIKHKEAFVKLNLKDIFFVEADRNYVNVYTKESNYVLRSSLVQIKEVLPTNFLQVHRSFIVNKNKIDSISKLQICLGEYTIPLSLSFKKRLYKALKLK